MCICPTSKVIKKKKEVNTTKVKIIITFTEKGWDGDWRGAHGLLRCWQFLGVHLILKFVKLYMYFIQFYEWIFHNKGRLENDIYNFDLIRLQVSRGKHLFLVPCIP